MRVLKILENILEVYLDMGNLYKFGAHKKILEPSNRYK
jgi:hypothetical protein